jgi:hypothetical protein
MVLMTNTEKQYLLNRMNNKAREVQLGDLIFGSFSSNSETVSGTLAYGTLIQPKASAAITSVTRHVLYGIGELTGTTAYGFGDVAESPFL